MELNGDMRHSAHSHTKQNQAGNKLPAVISFLRGILFSCIPCLITHTLLRSAAANPTLPVLTAGQLQEMLLMENCRKEWGAARWGLCQDPQPHCRTATVWANAWPKPVQESSELHLQHLLWKSHSSVHTGQVQQKLPLQPVHFYFKWCLSLWYLQVSQVLDFGSQIFASKPGTVHRDLSEEKNQIFTTGITKAENSLQSVQFIKPKRKRKKKSSKCWK